MSKDGREAAAISHDPTITPPRLHLHQRGTRPPGFARVAPALGRKSACCKPANGPASPAGSFNYRVLRTGKASVQQHTLNQETLLGKSERRRLFCTFPVPG